MGSKGFCNEETGGGNENYLENWDNIRKKYKI
jgi:hypothetical protein